MKAICHKRGLLLLHTHKQRERASSERERKPLLRIKSLSVHNIYPRNYYWPQTKPNTRWLARKSIETVIWPTDTPPVVCLSLDGRPSIIRYVIIIIKVDAGRKSKRRVRARANGSRLECGGPYLLANRSTRILSGGGISSGGGRIETGNTLDIQ